MRWDADGPGGGRAKAIPVGRRNCFRSLFEPKAPDIRAGAEARDETEGDATPCITRSRIAADGRRARSFSAVRRTRD